MYNILLRFRIYLKNHDIKFSPYGPLMHRWLPNNRNDCIDFITGNSDFVLKGWFERRGTTQNTFFEYEPNKAEIDESIIEKQGATDAGKFVL